MRGPPRIGFAAAVVAEVDREMARGGHRQDDDLCDERAAGERELDIQSRQDRLGGEPDHPAGEHGNDRPPEAVHGR